ncbi:hypothetical protein AIZ15_24550, partial [Salmonella enterica subsp. enterica serovar Typhimurium]
LLYIQIHLAVSIAEDKVYQHALAQTNRYLFVIYIFDTQKHQKSWADITRHLVLHGDDGTGYALK